jgi:hypothetical protein
VNILTSYHPALLAMQSLHDQFPGALSFYLFCNEDGLKTYHCLGQNKSIFIPTDILQSDNRIQVQKFRQVKKELIWGDLNDLPIGEGSTEKPLEIKQLSIQDEIEHNVLIFRIHSLTDDASDVFAISFSKTFSNFYIPSGRNVLSSDLKKSIGQTICNQVKWLYNLHEQQKNNINRIQLAYQNNADELERVNETLELERVKSRDLLEKYINQLVKDQELALNCKIQLKHGFLDKIKNSEVGIDILKSIIENAALTAYDLAIDQTRIDLTPNLITRSAVRLVGSETKSTQLIELDKTQALLDRYELAARSLTEKNLRINGKNLAEELQISAPAITDAIKKHNTKIRRLLEKHPSRWPLLCDFIRPIREIKWGLAANQ